MMRYVTFDQDGNLTGCYLQELAHDNHIEIDEATAKNWAAYKANAQRNGVELAPPVTQSPNVAILAQIYALEATVTQRRLRESVTTVDGKAWLANVDTQIAALRAQLV